MINTFELTLLNSLEAFWTDILAKIETSEDYIPEIFANLPVDGDFMANQKAIGEVFAGMDSGDPAKDLSFILQFPSLRTHVPGVSIEVGDDVENPVVGSFVAEVHDLDHDRFDTFNGGPFTKTYRVGVYSFNPDTTVYLYSAIKYGLLLLRQSLPDAASFLLHGRPMQIDYHRFSPDVVYFRYFDIAAEGIVDTAVTHAGIIKHTIAQAT